VKVYQFNFKTEAGPRWQEAPNSKLIFAVKIAAPYAILENGSENAAKLAILNSKIEKNSGFLHIWLFDDAVKFKSPYLTQSVVFILPALIPYLQIGPVTCIVATTEYSVQERPICCIGPYSRASLKPNFKE